MIKEAIRYNIEISDTLKNICAPLESFFDISLIAYRNFYLDGGLICLFNHHEWMRFSFDNNSWYSPSFSKRIQHLGKKNSLYYIWPEKPPVNDKVYCALYGLNIWNGVIVYKKSVDSLETFAFASTKENCKARDIYLLETDVFEHFISYFKDKVFSLIQPIEKKIIIPCKLDLSVDNSYEQKKKHFFEKTDIKNYYLRAEGINIRLSKQQEKCLAGYAGGRTIKDVARMLNLSSRTVEDYLNNIMDKTPFTCKSQLINLYQENRHHEILG